MAIPAILPWRRGDDFSYVTAVPFQLPAGAWTATAALRDARTPLVDPIDFGIVVTMQDLGVSTAADAEPGDHDWGMALRADLDTVLSWPLPRTAGEIVTLQGVITFFDGTNHASTDEFSLRRRP